MPLGKNEGDGAGKKIDTLNRNLTLRVNKKENSGNGPIIINSIAKLQSKSTLNSMNKVIQNDLGKYSFNV